MLSNQSQLASFRYFSHPAQELCTPTARDLSDAASPLGGARGGRQMVLPREGGHHSQLWTPKSAPTLGPLSAGKTEAQHSPRMVPLFFGPHGASTHYTLPQLDRYRPVGQQGTGFGPGFGKTVRPRFAEYKMRNVQTLTAEAFNPSPLPEVELYKSHQGYRSTPSFKLVSSSTIPRIIRPVPDSEIPACNYPPSTPKRLGTPAGGGMVGSASDGSLTARMSRKASTPTFKTRSQGRPFGRSYSPAFSTSSSSLSRLMITASDTLGP